MASLAIKDGNGVPQTIPATQTGGGALVPNSQNSDGVNNQLSASAANLALKTATGAMQGSAPGQWVAYSNAATTVVASATKAAGAAGVINICQGIYISLTGDATGAAAVCTVNLRDGATGAGTILAQFAISLPAGVGAMSPPIVLTGLNIPGTAATAMTLEFTAATGHALETCVLIGTTSA